MGNSSKSKKAATEPSISNFLSGVVGNTKDLVDNLIENVENAEKSARKGVHKIAKKDIKDLRKQTETLNDQVKKLSKVAKAK